MVQLLCFQGDTGLRKRIKNWKEEDCEGGDRGALCEATERDMAGLVQATHWRLLPRSHVAVLQSARAGVALLSGVKRGMMATTAKASAGRQSDANISATVTSGERWQVATQ